MGWYLATVLGTFDPCCKSLAKNRNNNFFFYFEMEILVLNEIFSLCYNQLDLTIGMTMFWAGGSRKMIRTSCFSNMKICTRFVGS